MVTTADEVSLRPDGSQTGTLCHGNLREQIEKAAHHLPAQGPITAFVHHNTLHAFERHSFDEAVVRGAEVFGCHPYLPEERYREKLARGRIQPDDIEAVLIDDLGDAGDELLGFFGTRYQLRMSMLAHPLRTGPSAELRWIIAETESLRTFRPETPPPVREQLIADTRRWVMRDLRNGVHNKNAEGRIRTLLNPVFERFDKTHIEQWNDATWEAFSLHALWVVCKDGAARWQAEEKPYPPSVRHRDLLSAVSGQDSDRLVHEVLIRFCAAFIDQGFAAWELPDRGCGFYQAFLQQYGQPLGPPDRWMRGLHRELNRLSSSGFGPLESIKESLELLGVSTGEVEEFISRTLLALRGYAGMLWQLETRSDRAARPVPEGSLVEFLAVRLILDRFALGYVAREHLGFEGSLADLRSHLESFTSQQANIGIEQRAFELFQLAQVIGWPSSLLSSMSEDEWCLLFRELDAFSTLQRRRVYHLAFERRYRLQTLDAVATHFRRRQKMTHDQQHALRRPSFQVVCCIDDRAESFRRHLEEIAPDCETLGAAGFFAVAMYYRGAADAHFTPLCPVIIKPQHYVTEEVAYTVEQADERRRKRRRTIGTATYRAHIGSRTFAGGWLAAVLGSLASIPLVLRILFPRATARLRQTFGTFVQTPALTKLQIERSEADPGPDAGQVGYDIEEMAGIVERLLRDIGLTKSFARLVFVCGHGSSSMNNPHEAAHDCGACAGGRGGPNARAFAQMANDPRVQRQVAKRGLLIPDDTIFVGAYHNSCDDSVAYYDLQQLPTSHKDDFQAAHSAIDEARARDAHERCRRFESAELSISPLEALRHVEGRAEDLSQVRPEYGHATNALCFVGRRDWSRGLFLDRRAFLQSYQPDQDDTDCSILTRILQAVFPVCAGINLEYYFSYVDPTGYGCGTKLPHNITSLLGVMNGAASDLLPGLPWQMVEIHEPVRLLFVIETTTGAMSRIIDRNDGIARLVCGGWVQLATLDTQSGELHLFRGGEFRSYQPTSEELPTKPTSLDWYRGWRDHLGFASITVSNEQVSQPAGAI